MTYQKTIKLSLVKPDPKASAQCTSLIAVSAIILFLERIELKSTEDAIKSKKFFFSRSLSFYFSKKYGLFTQ